MQIYTEKISIRGIKRPRIAFEINSASWYYFRIYQNEQLVFQNISYDKAFVVELNNKRFGTKPITEDDLVVKVIELHKFSLISLTYEITELTENEVNTIDYPNINELGNEVITTEKRYYKGDLHAHTFLSDGSLSPEDLIQHAEAVGLDFFFITDHNIFQTYWPKSDVLVLPGVEFTGNTGHWNGLNVKHEYDMFDKPFDIETLVGTHHLMDDLRNKGTLVSVNHPFLTIWSWLHEGLILDKIDCMELWNDPSYKDNPKATEEALNFWHHTLKCGHKISAVGGSDFHHLIDEKDNNRTNALNDPTTHVYLEQLDKETLLAGLKAGHVFVTRFIEVNAMNVLINEQQAIFGSQFEGEIPSQIVFSVDGETVDGELHVYTSTYHQSFKIIDNKVNVPIHLEENDFVRFEIRTESELISFTNPIYFGTLPRTATTFKDVRDTYHVEV
ncbi:CehA/McbA family metallohydrolase [Macrococcus sp. EM39E]|uniref:CehA/McbA family metallohydrolase n=1 Tax=Macrococcus animalis TaxID=3395467 RepID=UPI0039BDD205